MTDHDKTELEQNLTSRSTWIRLIYMLLFGFIFWLATMVLTVVVVLQFLHILIAGKGNENLLQFGRQLGIYFRQLIDFLCYSSDHQPFPFGAWPDVSAGTKSSAAKPAVKKKTPKKKAPK